MKKLLLILFAVSCFGQAKVDWNGDGKAIISFPKYTTDMDTVGIFGKALRDTTYCEFDSVWVPIENYFINDPSKGFVPNGDHITYNTYDAAIAILWHATVIPDNSVNIYVGISINGSNPFDDHTAMGSYVYPTDEATPISGSLIYRFTSGDQIQIVICASEDDVYIDIPSFTTIAFKVF